jgi:hypothetical protein
MQRSVLIKSVVKSIVLTGFAYCAFAQQPAPQAGQQAGQAQEGRGQGQGRGGRGGGGAGGGAPRAAVAMPPLFLKESWTRPADQNGQIPVTPANVSNPDLVLTVYGPDAKDLTISGAPGSETMPFNLWTGLCTAPVAATLKDKNNYVDLTGLAKVRWITRASGFHVVRPVVKLADGTWLVGDHTDASTTTFLESEFSFTGMRWIKLDIDRIVTTGTYGPVGEASSWVTNPDLSKVDEVGFVDLMPGTGHGSGGWVNVAGIEVYGKPVKR